MKRQSLKKVNAANLIVIHGTAAINFREDYDVPAMVQDILAAGRILEPIHAREGDMVVLKGNRRTEAAQVLLKDPATPAEIRKALENTEVFFYSDLTEAEQTELVLDQGGQKPLSRVETVKAVWRLQKMMYSEKDIIRLLYQQLALHTGNTRKAYEAQQLPIGKDRDAYLQTWLHGTVGNIIMTVGRMGDKVREQYILTETAKDRALTDDEKTKLLFRLDNARVKMLVSAQKADKEAKGWTPEKGGREFNAAIAKFTKEDKDGGKPKTPRAYSSEQMEQAGDAMQAPGMRLAFLQCAGKITDSDKNALSALDTEYHRRDKTFAILTANVDRVEGEKVKALIVSILVGTPDNVAEALKEFVQQVAVPVETPEETPVEEPSVS